MPQNRFFHAGTGQRHVLPLVRRDRELTHHQAGATNCSTSNSAFASSPEGGSDAGRPTRKNCSRSKFGNSRQGQDQMEGARTGAGTASAILLKDYLIGLIDFPLLARRWTTRFYLCWKARRAGSGSLARRFDSGFSGPGRK